MCEIVLLDLYFTEKASHKWRTLFQRIQIILSKEPIKQTNKQIKNKQRQMTFGHFFYLKWTEAQKIEKGKKN